MTDDLNGYTAPPSKSDTPYPQPNVQPPARNARRPMSGLGIAAFVLSLVAILSCYLPIINNVSFFIGILAIVFAISGLVAISKGRKSGKGLTIAALVIAIVACALVLFTQWAFSSVIDSATSGRSSTSATVNSSASSSAGGNANAGGSSGGSSSAGGNAATPGSAAQTAEYAVSIDGAAKTTAYDGSPAVVVTYTFTNNSDEMATFVGTVRDQVFQDNVQLQSAFVTSVDAGAALMEVKPGGTITCQEAYALGNEQSPITVECREYWVAGDAMLAEATFSLA